MYSRKIENGLALIGALIVLFGVGAAASTALADEAGHSGVTLSSVAATTDQR
jgi:2-methylisocitrate lyase-like PEP mutase family enzyme